MTFRGQATQGLASGWLAGCCPGIAQGRAGQPEQPCWVLCHVSARVYGSLRAYAGARLGLPIGGQGQNITRHSVGRRQVYSPMPLRFGGPDSSYCDQSPRVSWHCGVNESVIPVGDAVPCRAWLEWGTLSCPMFGKLRFVKHRILQCVRPQAYDICLVAQLYRCPNAQRFLHEGISFFR